MSYRFFTLHYPLNYIYIYAVQETCYCSSDKCALLAYSLTIRNLEIRQLESVVHVDILWVSYGHLRITFTLCACSIYVQ